MANKIVQVGPDREVSSTEKLLSIGWVSTNCPVGIPNDPRQPLVSAAKRMHYVGSNFTIPTYRLLALPSSMLQLDSGLLLHWTHINSAQYALQIHHRDCTCVSIAMTRLCTKRKRNKRKFLYVVARMTSRLRRIVDPVHRASSGNRAAKTLRVSRIRVFVQYSEIVKS